MSQKVGVKVSKGRRENTPVISKGAAEFVSIVDGVTFGVVEGMSFHSGRRDWSDEDQRSWALANAYFFESLARNLRTYASIKGSVGSAR